MPNDPGDEMETGERLKSLRSLSTFFSDRSDRNDHMQTGLFSFGAKNAVLDPGLRGFPDVRDREVLKSSLLCVRTNKLFQCVKTDTLRILCPPTKRRITRLAKLCLPKFVRTD